MYGDRFRTPVGMDPSRMTPLLSCQSETQSLSRPLQLTSLGGHGRLRVGSPVVELYRAPGIRPGSFRRHPQAPPVLRLANTLSPGSQGLPECKRRKTHCRRGGRPHGNRTNSSCLAARIVLFRCPWQMRSFEMGLLTASNSPKSRGDCDMIHDYTINTDLNTWKLAAWMMLANVLFNLDESLNKG